MDHFAYDLALREDPQGERFSPRYNEIMRRAVMDIVRREPWFVVRTLAAKTVPLVKWFLCYSAAGVWLLFLGGFSWREILPPLAGAAFYALPGLLVCPQTNYTAGMIAFAAVLGPCWLECAFRDGAFRKIGEAWVARGKPPLEK
jgi:hypothetical protein